MVFQCSISERDSPAEYARIQAITATENTTTVVEHAATTLHQAARDARVFKIPMQGVDDPDPPTSPVTAVDGDDAITQGLAALGALSYQDTQHPMATVRRPGVIGVDADLSATVAHVNAVKHELKAAMSTFGRSGWTVWRGQIPAWQHLNRLQAYRAWHWLAEPVRKLGFSWAGHTRSVEPLRIAALRERLSRQDRAAGHPHIESELAKLAGFDDNEVVVIRKPIAPTPIVNVAFADGRRRAIKTALPLIVPGPLPEVSPLPDFDPDKQARVRDDQAIGELLVSYWHVWRYQTPYRFRLPANPITARLDHTNGELSVRVRQQIAYRAAARGSRELSMIAATAAGARGPVPDSPALDRAGSLQVVAANRAHAYLVADSSRVWRVPIADLSA